MSQSKKKKDNMLSTILEHVKSKRMRQTISVLILIDFKYYIFLKKINKKLFQLNKNRNI